MDDPLKFRCKLCNKARSLCISWWSDHASGDKHKEIVEKRLNFFNNSKKKAGCKESEQLDSSSLSSTFKQLTVDGKINNSEVTYAEIRWVLKRIVSGFHISLVDDVCDTFQKMFSDSNIATRMKLWCTEATYIANFGISFYLLMLLHDSISKSPVYTLLFNESHMSVKWSW